jgi:putative GTP pyrophosphokinase
VEDRSELVERIAQEYSEERINVEQFVSRVKRLLTGLLQSEVDVSSVSGRAKEVESLKEKVAGNAGYASLDQVTDQAGLRVVCYYQDDIAKVRKVLTDQFEVLEVEQHGSSRAPEMFGYASVHLLVRLSEERRALPEWGQFAGMRAEIQIRTVLQDAWAVISHKLDYKSAADVPRESRRTLFRVSALLETSDGLFDQFRSQVDAARQDYKTHVETQRAPRMAINRESLREAWPHFPIEKITRIGVEAGMMDPGAAFTSDASRRSLARLVAVASSVGLDRIGQLQKIAEEIDQYADVFKLISSSASDKGFTPWAMPADMISWVIAAGREPAVQTLDHEGLIAAMVEALRYQEPALDLRDLRAA